MMDIDKVSSAKLYKIMNEVMKKIGDKFSGMHLRADVYQTSPAHYHIVIRGNRFLFRDALEIINNCPCDPAYRKLVENRGYFTRRVTTETRSDGNSKVTPEKIACFDFDGVEWTVLFMKKGWVVG